MVNSIQSNLCRICRVNDAGEMKVCNDCASAKLRKEKAYLLRVIKARQATTDKDGG